MFTGSKGGSIGSIGSTGSNRGSIGSLVPLVPFGTNAHHLQINQILCWHHVYVISTWMWHHVGAILYHLAASGYQFCIIWYSVDTVLTSGWHKFVTWTVVILTSLWHQFGISVASLCIIWHHRVINSALFRLQFDIHVAYFFYYVYHLVSSYYHIISASFWDQGSMFLASFWYHCINWHHRFNNYALC